MRSRIPLVTIITLLLALVTPGSTFATTNQLGSNAVSLETAFDPAEPTAGDDLTIETTITIDPQDATEDESIAWAVRFSEIDGLTITDATCEPANGITCEATWDADDGVAIFQGIIAEPGTDPVELDVTITGTIADDAGQVTAVTCAEGSLLPSGATPEATPGSATPCRGTEGSVEVTVIPPVAPTEEPTEVPTEQPTEIPTEVPTEVPTATSEPTEEPTAIPTEVPTEAPTATAEPTATATPEPTATTEPSPTPQPTATTPPSQTPEPSATATPEPTATTEPTATSTAEPTATIQPTASQEPTATTQPTQTPESSATTEATQTATSEPTSTSEPTAAATETATVTQEPTSTGEPTTQATSTTAPDQPTATVQPTATATTAPAPTPDDDGGSNIGLWVGVGALVVLAGAAGVVWNQRRNTP